MSHYCKRALDNYIDKMDRHMLSDPQIMLPTEVLLNCKTCNYLWIQTIREALALPSATVKCPFCNAPYMVHSTDKPDSDSDTPVIVE